VFAVSDASRRRGGNVHLRKRPGMVDINNSRKLLTGYGIP
jgi:hypothetical protein